jgi:ABC-type glycerol-3-phosphate transport system substrate-binding protein
LGKAKFNAQDSPFRHSYEWYKKANDNGWIPDKMWTRQWEGDMEASYIAGKSVMMLHGPWVWDKALAAGSTFKQEGLPSTPPADGGQWLQFSLPPNIDNQYFIRKGVDKKAEWPEILTAWNWFFSPDAIPMRAQAEGRWPLYNLDQSLDLKGPQFQAVLKEIGSPGDKWENVKFEEGLTGTILAGPYRKKGARGIWDWEANGNNEVFADLLSGKITVQGALDIAQRNWEESYEGLPLG